MGKTKLPATERVVSYVEPSTGYWVIPSEKGDIALAQNLLPSMTQEQAARYTHEERFHPMSVPEHFELIGNLYLLRETGGEVEDARQFLRTALRNDFPLTLTRLSYQPQENDRIIHGYGTDAPIEHQVDLVGDSGNVLEVLSQEDSLALTGKTPEEVAELMQYINGTPAYVWRLGKKPQSVDERVAGFIADSSRALLSCVRYPRVSRASLGVKNL
ncbi:MAG: hypothetical protein KKG75_03580 [Nanoarchaeota archaeon]|nr:hypothetical protein [Nanoarchaeota archaeon]